MQADAATIIREGHGTGEGRGISPGEVHDTALKAAETDATKRALATFGRPFGLELYQGRHRQRRSEGTATPAKPMPVPAAAPSPRSLCRSADPRVGFHPDDTTPIPRPSRYYGRRHQNELAEHFRGERRQAERTMAPSARTPLSQSSAPPLAPGAQPELAPSRIDKSLLDHRRTQAAARQSASRFVASQPCLVCGRQPLIRIIYALPSPEPSASKSATSLPCRYAVAITGNCIRRAMRSPGGRGSTQTAGGRQIALGGNASKICWRRAQCFPTVPQSQRPSTVPDTTSIAPIEATKNEANSSRSTMSSPKQIAANRRNAFKSTGPVTEEGKNRSRRNAVRHGLTAETVIATLEDTEDYQAFEAAVTADYDAETAVERELVLRLASVLWRLRRATGIETALFASVTARPDSYQQEQRPKSEAAIEIASHSEQNRLVLVATRDYHTPNDHSASGPLGTNRNKTLAMAFLHLAALPTFPLDRLSRYEHLLWRQARQLVFTLESQRRRRHQPKRASFPFSFRLREPDDFSKSSGERRDLTANANHYRELSPAPLERVKTADSGTAHRFHRFLRYFFGIIRNEDHTPIMDLAM